MLQQGQVSPRSQNVFIRVHPCSSEVKTILVRGSASLDFETESLRLHELAGHYQPRMDIADAAIVRLSEIYPHHTVLTMDREDFTIYRRHRTQPLPCDFGPVIKL